MALQEVNNFHFSYDRHILQLMSGSANKTKFYTGLPTYVVFKALFYCLELKMLLAWRDSYRKHQQRKEEEAISNGRILTNESR